MRLKQKETEAIKEVTKAIFGENAIIRLFGSRTNDSLKGGDIDLLIHCNRTISSSEQYQLKIKFLVQLKKIIGDQKIDVLVDGGQQQQSFFQTVINEGILLWLREIKWFNNAISEATIGNIDQLVFRFTKLQDEIGNNTFRYMLEYLQEDINDKPFRDILNTLERLQIIDSSDTWLSLRELQNDLAHDYPMMIDETIDKLNFLILQLPLIENILKTIDHQIKR